MSATPATYHRNRMLLTRRDTAKLQGLLLERGELATRDLLGVSRHVALRAAAQLYITDAQEQAIREGLAKAPGHNP